jgi:hypothetical protein
VRQVRHAKLFRAYSKETTMKMIKSVTCISVLTAPAFFVGCAEDVDSKAIRTEGIYANYQAVASGDGTTQVRAELRVGGNNAGATYIKLTGDDQLIASADQDGDGEPDSAKMGHNNSGNRHWYLSRFTTDEDNTEFNIAFNRGDDDESAPNSNVRIPKPFSMSVEGIDEGDEIERGTDVVVTWSNEDGGDIKWEISGDCIWTESGRTSDDMEFTISAEDIRVLSTDEGESCTVKVTLERTRMGTVDPAFGEGGVFWGIQRRGFEFTSTPAPGEGEGGDGGAGGGN